MNILDKAVPLNCPERQILVGSKTVTLLGGEIKVGQTAPEFVVQANDWSSMGGLASTAGKIRVLASIPSLSTPVCEREIRRFNERIEDFGVPCMCLSSMPICR
ncbi:MAG: redoxin domain-containing protein [Chloroflexota bacterium]|mgnify:CR=1 FL=1